MELCMIKHGSECGILRDATLSSMNQPKGRDEVLSTFIEEVLKGCGASNHFNDGEH